MVQSARLVAPCGIKIDNARPIAEIFPLSVGFVVVHFFQKFGLRQVLRLCAGNAHKSHCRHNQGYFFQFHTLFKQFSTTKIQIFASSSNFLHKSRKKIVISLQISAENETDARHTLRKLRPHAARHDCAAGAVENFYQRIVGTRSGASFFIYKLTNLFASTVQRFNK